jgi:hypothetical protein
MVIPLWREVTRETLRRARAGDIGGRTRQRPDMGEVIRRSRRAHGTLAARQTFVSLTRIRECHAPCVACSVLRQTS